MKNGKIRFIGKLLLILVLFAVFHPDATVTYAEDTPVRYVALKNEKDAYQKFAKSMRKLDFSTIYICPQTEVGRYSDVGQMIERQEPLGWYELYWKEMIVDHDGRDWIGYKLTARGGKYNKAKIQRRVKQTKRKAQMIARQIKRKYSSDEERIRAAHDYLCRNVRKLGVTGSNQFTAYGALILGEATCHGYSQAFDMLLFYMDIPCIVVVGYAFNGGGHAWNLVLYRGKSRYIDVTWDDLDDGYGGIDYTYYMRTQGSFQSSHLWDKSTSAKKYLKWQ